MIIRILISTILLGFLSPIYAEDVEKKWLESPGSTSEWLETKNWDNDYWWRLYLPLYLQVKQGTTNPVVIHSVFDKKMIDSKKIRSCWNFLELHDMPKEVEKSCISLHQKAFKDKKDKEFFYRDAPSAYIAFLEGKNWNNLDTLRTQDIKNIKNSMPKKSAEKKIKRINDYAADTRGFFNDEYITKLGFNETPDETRLYFCNNYYIKKELEKNPEPRVSIYPSLSVFAYCHDKVMSYKKDDTHEIWESYKQKVYELGKCIEAKDFIGCAKHNKMDWLIE